MKNLPSSKMMGLGHLNGFLIIYDASMLIRLDYEVQIFYVPAPFSIMPFSI